MSNLPPPPDDPNLRRAPRKAEDAETSRQTLNVALARLWERSRKTLADHVETLQEAKTLAGDNKLDEPGRLRAVDSAHKLAGVLGTFGLPRGTELARLAEETFGNPATMSGVQLGRLDSALDELAGMVTTAVPSVRAEPSL